MIAINVCGITTMLGKIDIFINNVVIIEVKNLGKRRILYKVYTRTYIKIADNGLNFYFSFLILFFSFFSFLFLFYF